MAITQEEGFWLIKLYLMDIFWSYMMTKAHQFVQRCDKCQRFSPVNHHPVEPLRNTLAICKMESGYRWTVAKVSRR